MLPTQALIAWYEDETGLASSTQPWAASVAATEEPQRPRDARLRTPPKPCGASWPLSSWAAAGVPGLPLSATPLHGNLAVHSALAYLRYRRPMSDGCTVADHTSSMKIAMSTLLLSANLSSNLSSRCQQLRIFDFRASKLVMLL